MNGKKVLAAVVSVLGLMCLLAGLIVLTGETLKSASGLCIGIGSAALVLGLGSFIRLITVPEEELKRQVQQKDIELHDERNIRIHDKAGAMTNKILFYVLCASVLVFGLAGDLPATLMLTGIIILDSILVIVFSGCYSKQI